MSSKLEGPEIPASKRSRTQPICVRETTDRIKKIDNISKECGVQRSDILRLAITILLASIIERKSIDMGGFDSADMCTILKELMNKFNVPR